MFSNFFLSEDSTNSEQIEARKPYYVILMEPSKSRDGSEI